MEAAERLTSPCSHLPHSANCLVYVVYGHGMQLGYNREHFSSFLLLSFSDNTKTFGLELLNVWLFHNLNVNMNMRGPPHIWFKSDSNYSAHI